MDEDEFKSELDMGKRGGGQMLTIIEFPILLLHIHIDPNTTALLIRAAFGIFWLKSPLFGANT